jgi:hypothetical protein
MRSLMSHILALEALGWHLVGFGPDVSGDAPPLWNVTIERTDRDAFMTASDVDLDVVLEISSATPRQRRG